MHGRLLVIRRRNDLVIAFKILIGAVSLNTSTFFAVADSYTMKGDKEIRVPSCKKQVRPQFFSNNAVVLLSKAFTEGLLHLSLGSFRSRASEAVSEAS